MATKQEKPTFLVALALLYHRHGVTQRALLYAATAAKLDLWSPGLALLLASLFLKLKEPEQALAALSRFNSPEQLLYAKPTQVEEMHALKLMARAYLRLGDKIKAYKLAEEAKRLEKR